MIVDPKSVKKTVKLSIFFTLSGSTSVKAVRRMLMKLSPDGIEFFSFILQMSNISKAF